MAGINIDEVRGFAAILVVAFHAIASEPSLFHSVWGYFVASLSYVRMPLFIAVTGYLYGAQRSRRPLSFAGWEKRTRRIVPPFLLATVVCWVLSAPTDHAFNISVGLIFGAWHLWYLQALAVILLVMTMIDVVVRPTDAQLWLLVVAAFLLAALDPLTGFGWFSIDRALYLLPHFLAGGAIGAMPQIINHRPTRMVIYALGLIGVILQQLSYWGYIPLWSRQSLVAGAIGVTSFVFVARHMGQNETLRRIGAYSFPIFLWHLPVSSVISGLLLRRIDIERQLAVLVKIGVGVVVPIIVTITCMRYAPRLLPFVGRRASSKLLRVQD